MENSLSPFFSGFPLEPTFSNPLSPQNISSSLRKKKYRQKLPESLSPLPQLPKTPLPLPKVTKQKLLFLSRSLPPFLFFFPYLFLLCNPFSFLPDFPSNQIYRDSNYPCTITLPDPLSYAPPQNGQTTLFMQPFSPSNNSQTKRFLSDSMMTRVDPRIGLQEHPWWPIGEWHVAKCAAADQAPTWGSTVWHGENMKEMLIWTEICKTSKCKRIPRL